MERCCAYSLSTSMRRKHVSIILSKIFCDNRTIHLPSFSPLLLASSGFRAPDPYVSVTYCNTQRERERLFGTILFRFPERPSVIIVTWLWLRHQLIPGCAVTQKWGSLLYVTTGSCHTPRFAHNRLNSHVTTARQQMGASYGPIPQRWVA